MRSAVIGGPGSQLHGIRTKCCNRKTISGQNVHWLEFRNVGTLSFRERAVILHDDCMAAMAAKAPAGAPSSLTAVEQEFAALAAAANAA